MRINFLISITRKVFLIVVLTMMSFSAFSQEKDEGASQHIEKETQVKCVLIGTQCLASGERMIDGEKVYRECWDVKNHYDCFTDEIIKDTCQGIASTPGCFLKTSVCLVKDPDGNCQQEERIYVCGSLLFLSNVIGEGEEGKGGGKRWEKGGEKEEKKGEKKREREEEFLNTEYTITRDELDTRECDPHELNENCEVIENKCVDPAEKRNINGKDIYKDCWRYEKKYVCKTGSFISDCQEFKKREGLKKGGCQFIGERCLSRQDDSTSEDSYLRQAKSWLKRKVRTGECYHTEKKYYCEEGAESAENAESKGAEIEGQNGQNEQKKQKKQKEQREEEGRGAVFRCGSVQYCIEGRDEEGQVTKTCDKLKRPQNKNLGKAVMYLNILKQAKNELVDQFCSPDNKGSCKLFTGYRRKCKKDPLGARNCCSHDQGWLEKLNFLGCGENEKLLATQHKKGFCHYVDSYCSKKTPKPFSVCLEKKQGYCCFKSKLSKLIQEQGRIQLGLGWGDGEDPECRALTIDEFQRLDFSKLDLREVLGEIEAKVTQRTLGLKEQNQAKGKIEETVKFLKEKRISFIDQNNIRMTKEVEEENILDSYPKEERNKERNKGDIGSRMSVERNERNEILKEEITDQDQETSREKQQVEQRILNRLEGEDREIQEIEMGDEE